MRKHISRTTVAGISAFAMSATVLCLATPASAFGGFHGGFGGVRPAFGGFHSGFVGVHPGLRPGFVGVHPGLRPGFVGVHPGLRPGFVGVHPGFRPGFHPAFAGRRVFHPGFWRNGVWTAGWRAPVVVGGTWWGGYGGCWTYQPVYDAAGNYLGYASVNMCS